MNYREFLKEIYAKSAGKKKLELVHIKNFLKAVGNPEKKLNAVHIAGTNGKGSVSAIVESILTAHSFLIGMNTSPHLVDFNERFRINKQRVAETKLLNNYLEFRHLHQKYDTSYFEITTCIAVQIFLEEQMDYAIMEVGMGGRLDASVLVNAVITAITNIDYDHMKTLGSSLTEIAREKAGILKKDIPVAIGIMPEVARQTIISIAKKIGSPILDIEEEIKISNVKLSKYSSCFDLDIPRYNIKYEKLACNLVGIHQVDNSALAILICAALAEKFGWHLQESNVKEGLATIIWEGRMQKIGDNPFVLIDGAHNPAGIEKLVYNLLNIYEYQKLIIVVAIFYDKDFRTMIKNLSSIADLFVICKSQAERAAEIEDLSKETEKYTSSFIVEKDINNALAKAREIAKPDDLICVTGSLYTIGEVLKNDHKSEQSQN